MPTPVHSKGMDFTAGVLLDLEAAGLLCWHVLLCLSEP
jgi:hypothetical protein